MSDSPPPLVDIRNLCVHYPTRTGLFGHTREVIRAVDDISFTLTRGQTVGLVGESGSGKTTTGRSLVRLAPITSGTLLYEGKPLNGLSDRQSFPYRKKIQMVFQDPFNSLNPRMTCGAIIGEALDIHFPDWEQDRRQARIAELLTRVGLQPSHAERHPHEFSGGQRQRIGIARALAVEPECLVLDEPVSALDVSVQAQIVNLLRDLQRQLGLTYLFIAHDLAVVAHMSDEILVMTEGKIVERGPAERLIAYPEHEYTRRLLAAVPTL